MNTCKGKKVGSLIFAALVVSSFGVIAGGNGNGNEPPSQLNKTSGDLSFFCSVLPFFCSTSIKQSRGGNGNGNEPD
jgi:hypothetical protein